MPHVVAAFPVLLRVVPTITQLAVPAVVTA